MVTSSDLLSLAKLAEVAIAIERLSRDRAGTRVSKASPSGEAVKCTADGLTPLSAQSRALGESAGLDPPKGVDVVSANKNEQKLLNDTNSRDESVVSGCCNAPLTGLRPKSA